MTGKRHTIWSVVCLLVCGLSAVATAADTKLTLSVEPGELDNTFFPSEEKSVDVLIHNPGEEPLMLTLNVRMALENGEVRESSQQVEVPAAGDKRAPVALDLDGPCFADCTFSVEGQEAEARTTVAVVRPPQLDDLPFAQAFYGTHAMTHPATAKRVGIRFFRTMLRWRWTEREQGHYDFSKNVETAREALESGVGHVWTFEPDLPDWLDVGHKVLLNKPEPLALFRQWVLAATEALPKERIAIEMNNEPDITMGRTKLVTHEEAVQSAADLLKTGYEAVKSVDPSIPVLGGGSSGSQAKPGGFAEEMLIAADGDADYYSAHLYCNMRYVKTTGAVMWPDEYLVPMLEQNARLAVEHTKKKVLWSTELGWAYPMDDVYLSETTRDYAAITAQALVLLKTVEHVGKIAWFRGYQYRLGLNERGYDYSLFVQQGPRMRPTTGVCAFATVSSLLEGAPTGQELDLGPAMRGYLFENKLTGQAVAALWTTHYDASLKETLPAGVTIIDLFGRELDASDWLISRGPSFLTVPLDQAKPLRAFLEGAHWRPEQPFIVSSLGANNVNEFHVEIESLLIDPVVATVSIGGDQVRWKLHPGTNEVILPCSDGVVSGEVLSETLRVEGAEASIEVPVNKILLAVPYQPADVVDLGAGLTPEKRSLAVYKIDAKEDLFPPDPAIPWEGPQDLSVHYGYAWSDEGLYAIYEISDDRVLTTPTRDFWNHDSMQLALDPFTIGKVGYQPGQRELGTYLDESGEAGLVQGYPPRDDKPEISVRATKTDTGVTYEWFIPWDYLYGRGVEPGAGDVLGANFIVNDNDGSGRDCWMGVADGIGENKNPTVYPWLYLEP